MIVSVTITDSRETEIAGAIRSVVDHVDRVLLVDTGVTDGTIERAREVAGEKLSVAIHEWVDFATARNFALEAANDMGATWAVVVDSDEEINFGDFDLRGTLARTISDVLILESDDGFYPKWKIIRVDSKAHFVGPTHEALVGGTREVLRGVTFSELQKTEAQLERKLLRDIALLLPYSAEHPNDPRWPLYLGLSFEGLGQTKNAVRFFALCAELQKTGDQAAWALFKQAEQLFRLEHFEAALEAAVRGAALGDYPECAWMAAESALKLDRRDDAISWARVAEALGYFKGCPVERLFFRHLSAFYELPYRVLSAALPLGADQEQAERDFRAAKLARLDVIDTNELEELSVTRDVVASDRTEARSMLRPKTLAQVCSSARATPIQFDAPNGWAKLNPSVCSHRGELWCSIRTTNYTIRGRKYSAPDGIIRTENYLGRLLNDGRLIDVVHMRDLDASKRCESSVFGYEDVRLASVDGSLVGAAAVYDRVPGRIRVAKLRLSHGDVVDAEVQPSNQPYEKNWMPLTIGNSLAWIYSLDPTAILPGPLHWCPLALDHLRGGAATKFDDGYLCVTHEVIDEPESRIYLHRFVRLDEMFRVVAVTPTWVFAHHGIEFCAGLAIDGEDVVISYGLRDKEAWITRVNAREIRGMPWIVPCE